MPNGVDRKLKFGRNFSNDSNNAEPRRASQLVDKQHAKQFAVAVKTCLTEFNNGLRRKNKKWLIVCTSRLPACQAPIPNPKNNEEQLGGNGYQAACRLANANISTMFLNFNLTELPGMVEQNRNLMALRDTF